MACTAFQMSSDCGLPGVTNVISLMPTPSAMPAAIAIGMFVQAGDDRYGERLEHDQGQVERVQRQL